MNSEMPAVKPSKWRLVIFCAVPIIISGIISFLLPKQEQVTSQWNVPAFMPPSWLFPVVWTVLYIMIGIASYRIYTYSPDSSEKRTTLKLHLLQLFFNFLWPVTFFGLQNLPFSVCVILILLGLIIATWYKMKRMDNISGWLFVPYILWVVFASALNIAFWFMN